jgi:hypothetical protein
VQELEDLQRFRVGGAGTQEEQLVLYYRVEEGCGVGVGEVDQRRAGVRMREVERKQRAAGGRAADVCVLEEGRAVGGSAIAIAPADCRRTCAHQRCTAPRWCSWFRGCHLLAMRETRSAINLIRRACKLETKLEVQLELVGQTLRGGDREGPTCVDKGPMSLSHASPSSLFLGAQAYALYRSVFPLPHLSPPTTAVPSDTHRDRSCSNGARRYHPSLKRSEGQGPV